MIDMHEDSAMIIIDSGREIANNVDHHNIVQSLEPYEGMKFVSFEDAKDHYTRYTRNGVLMQRHLSFHPLVLWRLQGMS